LFRGAHLRGGVAAAPTSQSPARRSIFGPVSDLSTIASTRRLAAAPPESRSAVAVPEDRGVFRARLALPCPARDRPSSSSRTAPCWALRMSLAPATAALAEPFGRPEPIPRHRKPRQGRAAQTLRQRQP
jgi:hypothetical protein